MNHDHVPTTNTGKEYVKFFTIILLVVLATFSNVVRVLVESQVLLWIQWMQEMMATFLVVFGGVKLLDVRGFQSAYMGYDLLAGVVPAYGLLYPFLEVGLGFWILSGFESKLAMWAVVILMGFSTLGVIRVLMQRKKLHCACLGSVVKLPVSTITLVENLAMVVMAIVMIVVLPF